MKRSIILISKRYSLVTVIAYLLFFSSCSDCTSDDSINNPQKIKAFHDSLFSPNSELKRNTPFNLYIDYSTCVSQAEKGSTDDAAFYHDLRPKLIDCKPILYSIKGEEIQKESGELYTLLRRVKEVNYADIKSAVEQIVDAENQAILITDGEYFQGSHKFEHHNDPYLGDSFKSWVKKGNEIYIIAEKYLESRLYEKYRYYMVFTNSKIPNNIYQKIKPVVDRYKGTVPCLHLSITGLRVENKFNTISDSTVNVTLSNVNSYKKGNMEYQHYQISWSQMVEFVKNGFNQETGEPLPLGDFLIKGYKLNYGGIKYHHIKKIGIKVYDVYDAYRTFEFDTLVEYGGHFVRNGRIEELKNIFQIDQDYYKNTGEILLRIHPDFTGKGLNHCKYDKNGKKLNYSKENLLRVDLVIEEVEDNFQNHEKDFEVLKWPSISKFSKGGMNVSVYESVKNLVEDRNLSPKIINGGVLYSFYIRTFPSDL